MNLSGIALAAEIISYGLPQVDFKPTPTAPPIWHKKSHAKSRRRQLRKSARRAARKRK